MKTDLRVVMFWFFMVKFALFIIVGWFAKENLAIIYGFWCGALAIIVRLFYIEHLIKQTTLEED